jgi:hypothetical protein
MIFSVTAPAFKLTIVGYQHYACRNFTLDCTQVFHAINGLKCPFWQFSGEKLLQEAV